MTTRIASETQMNGPRLEALRHALLNRGGEAEAERRRFGSGPAAMSRGRAVGTGEEGREISQRAEPSG